MSGDKSSEAKKNQRRCYVAFGSHPGRKFWLPVTWREGPRPGHDFHIEPLETMVVLHMAYEKNLMANGNVDSMESKMDTNMDTTSRVFMALHTSFPENGWKVWLEFAEGTHRKQKAFSFPTQIPASLRWGGGGAFSPSAGFFRSGPTFWTVSQDGTTGVKWIMHKQPQFPNTSNFAQSMYRHTLVIWLQYCGDFLLFSS